MSSSRLEDPDAPQRRPSVGQVLEQTRGARLLDVLRGWPEAHDPALTSEHLLPALLELVPLRGGPTLSIHGPTALLGRYHPGLGPVDLWPAQLPDHELYTIGSPHVFFALEQGQWHMTCLTGERVTCLNRTPLLPDERRHPLASGDLVTLGRRDWRVVCAEEGALARWGRLRDDLLMLERGPALLLKRAGGLCGPRLRLNPQKRALIGRAGALDPDLAPPDWDLAGLPDHERRFVASRHVAIGCVNERWELTPLARRQRVYVNRQEILRPVLLRDGDEIGLGTVLTVFHDPLAMQPATQHTVKLRRPGEVQGG